MELSNIYTILGILVSTLILISIIYRFWSKYNSSSSQGIDISSTSAMSGGYKKWRKLMRKK
jgi:hypothetical protein